MSRVKRTSGYLNINCYSGAINCKMKCSSLFFAIIYGPRVEVLKYVIPTYMALIRSTYLRLRLWAALSKIYRMMSFAYLSRLERLENTAWRSWTTHRICREVNFTGSHPACWSCGRVSPQRICPVPGALACGMTPSQPHWAWEAGRESCRFSRMQSGSSTPPAPIGSPYGTTCQLTDSWQRPFAAASFPPYLCLRQSWQHLGCSGG